jgi:adenosylcobyric acid synthase
MRGDISLFADGMEEIARRTGWPSMGLVPFFEGARALPAEDAYDLAERTPARSGGRIRIAVPLLPRIANFDDLDPLAAEPDVELIMTKRGSPLPACDLIVLPGSKATIADLDVLREEGWDIDIAAHVRRGGRVLGLCGGYQMLGQTIADPDGVDGPAGTAPGLGLLDIDTVMRGDKSTTLVRGIHRDSGTAVEGYEIHLGRSEGADCARPLLDLDGRPDGAMSRDGRVQGTYVHGLFTGDAFRKAWLARFGIASSLAYETRIEAALDALADHLETYLDIEQILSIARSRHSSGNSAA